VTWLSSRIVDPNDKYIAAICASEGSIAIDGTSASGGRSARTWFTRALMSASALPALKFSFSRALIVESPCALCDSR
jgi:hypothetical protein